MPDSLQRFLSITALLVAALCAGFSQARAQSREFAYAPQSVLSQGRWVKVRVTQTGVHAISDAELRAMGFEQPEKVTVHGYPAVQLSHYRLTPELPDDLPQVAAVRHANRLLFYGVADTDFSMYTTRSGGRVLYPVNLARNYYARYSEYFLTDSRPVKAPVQVSFDSDVTTFLTSCRSVVHIEEEVQNTHQLGARFFGADFGAVPNQSVPFAMPGYLPDRDITLQGAMAIFSPAGSAFGFPVTLPSGNQFQIKVPRHPENDYHYYGTRFTTYDRPPLADDGRYTLSVNAAPYQITYGGFDYLTVSYPRSTRLEGKTQELLLFPDIRPDWGVALSLPQGEEGAAAVWDVTDPGAVRVLHTLVSAPGEIKVTPGMDGDLVEDVPERRIAVFNPVGELLGVSHPTLVAASNLHALPTPRLLIVAASRWLKEAERLAAAHRRTQGIDVAVVPQEFIYNEFSSGTPHVMGLRRFVHMLHHRNPGKLRSVLLFGGATYDNRNLLGLPEEEFSSTYIPMYQCEDISMSGRKPKSFATDCMVGMLDANPDEFSFVNLPMTVNVSRIPARMPQDAVGVVNKIVNYLEHPPVADRHSRALLMSDKGDTNSHLSDSEKIGHTIERADSTVTVTRAYNSLYPITFGKAAQLNRQIAGTLSRGVAYWGYTGHATPMILGGAEIWSNRLCDATDYPAPPFAMLATCRPLYFDHSGRSFGEALLYKERGGAICVVGGMREVYQQHNRPLNVNIARHFFTAEPDATFGDVYRRAHNASIPLLAQHTSEEVDYRYNTIAYSMIGDPELPVSRPGFKVNIAGLQGLTALTPTTVTGEITDLSGNRATGFCGKVYLSLFDGAQTAKVINVNDADGENSFLGEEVRLESDQIYQAEAEVTNGVFTMELFVPVPTRLSSGHRLTLFASSTDNSMHASGVIPSLSVAIPSAIEEPSPSTAPEITEMYLDRPEFRSGDVTSPHVTLHAAIAPNPCGIVGYSAQIGQSLSLVLDGATPIASAPAALSRHSDGSATLAVPLPTLRDGLHTLTLTVRNHASQATSHTISFTSVASRSEARVRLPLHPVGGDSVEVAIEGAPADAELCRLTLADASGRGVATLSAPSAASPVAVPLTASDGTPLPSGRYTVAAYLRCGNRYMATPAATLIIRR